MFVKKLLNLFAISFFSVSIFPSTLKNSGSCVLVVVLLVTSLMTFHVFLISFVYLLASADNILSLLVLSYILEFSCTF